MPKLRENGYPPERRRRLALFPPESEVDFVSFGPDGSTFVTGGNDNPIRLWDSESGRCLRVFDARYSANVCAWSRDGHALASAGDDEVIRIWDVASGRCIRKFETDCDGIRSLVWVADDTGILALSMGYLRPEHDGTACEIALWHVETRQCLSWRELPYGVTAADITPCGTTYAAADDEGRIRIHDRESGACIQTLEGHDDLEQWEWDNYDARLRVETLAFGRGGDVLVSTAGYDDPKVWDVASGKCLYTVTKPWDRTFGPIPSPGETRCWSPDGTMVLIANSRGDIRLWEVESGRCIRRINGAPDSHLSACVFGPSGSAYLSSGDAGPRLWDSESGRCLGAIEVPPSVSSPPHPTAMACAIDPTGARALFAKGSLSSVVIWEEPGNKVIREISVPGGGNYCALSLDGSTLLTATFHGDIRLWDVQSGRCTTRRKGRKARLEDCSLSPDGSTILLAYSDGLLQLWNQKSRRSTGTVKSAHSFQKACVGHDGTTIFCAGEGEVIRQLEVETGRCLQAFRGHTDQVRDLSVSADGTHLLSTSWDHTLRLWDLASGRCTRIHAMLGGHHAVWEPDTGTLLEADEQALRWLFWQVGEEGAGWTPVSLEGVGPVPRPRRS